MLNDLKKTLQDENDSNFELESILESTLDIKDVFLDDPETALIGAEDDPEIEALVDKVPEYSDDPDVKEDIESLTESVAATATRHGSQSAEDIKALINRLGIINRKLQSEIGLYRKRGNLHQVSITSNKLRENEKKIDELQSKLNAL